MGFALFADSRVYPNQGRKQGQSAVTLIAYSPTARLSHLYEPALNSKEIALASCGPTVTVWSMSPKRSCQACTV